MMLGARTAAWGGKDLPYDAEVEWLKADGYAVIDTMIPISDSGEGYVFKCEMSADRFVKYGSFFGQKYISETANIKRIIFAEESNALYANWGSTGNGSTRILIKIIGSKVLVEMGAGYAIMNGTRNNLIERQGSPNTNNLCLFNVRTLTTSVRDIGTTIYWFDVEKDGVAIARFKPVRKDGVGYMYDSVRKMMFGNANEKGLGLFSFGPDKT